MDNERLYFALSNYGQFGQKRFQATLAAGEKRTIPITVPTGRYYVVTKIRFGDITADAINFRFNNVRNYFEENILIGTELLNDPVCPEPYIVISGTGEMVVENTDVVERDFSVVLDFYLIDNEIQGRIRELVLGKREDFRGKITEQQYHTPIS